MAAQSGYRIIDDHIVIRLIQGELAKFPLVFSMVIVRLDGTASLPIHGQLTPSIAGHYGIALTVSPLALESLKIWNYVFSFFSDSFSSTLPSGGKIMSFRPIEVEDDKDWETVRGKETVNGNLAASKCDVMVPLKNSNKPLVVAKKVTVTRLPAVNPYIVDTVAELIPLVVLTSVATALLLMPSFTTKNISSVYGAPWFVGTNRILALIWYTPSCLGINVVTLLYSFPKSNCSSWKVTVKKLSAV